MGFTNSGTKVTAASTKDVEIPESSLPSDSTSALEFSPTQDLLAVASWNNEVRIYEVNAQGQSNGKAGYSHAAPAFCLTWSSVSLFLIL